MPGKELVIGVDVGSTTVKAAVILPHSKQILWSKYRRHHTRQAELVFSFLEEILNEFHVDTNSDIRIFVTGSGGLPLTDVLGAKFVQEVNAVTMAVEELHPNAGSVVELGGQDAKIIIFKENEKTGGKHAITSMNDKCASGTGATIDKCMIKVGMDEKEVMNLQFDDSKLHHVAAKCGVFAETDIVNLTKSGIPAPEIMCSLADAIVLQNLSVLSRGNTLRHEVILLGGPNTYLPFLQDCWKKRIKEVWDERQYDYPRHIDIDELIYVPEHSQYYAAFGAAVYGLHEPKNVGVFKGITPLNDYIMFGRKSKLGETAGSPLVKDQQELDQFKREYQIPAFQPAEFSKGEIIRAILGVDGGSTSSKAVLTDEKGQVLFKAYQLSKGNPLQDTKQLLKLLKEQAEVSGAILKIVGFGATGYAADVLEKTLNADVNIVETVAHMQSAVHFYDDIDVICDVGGQDIKVLFLKNGEIRNFRLSNQCSAGNGMLLQAMADQFDIEIDKYAETAFHAELSPKFSYGCAVFLDTDRVNFQKEGYSKEELLAGLAFVLPKNIWQYVVQIPRMAELGKRFVLQGGTQHNLAAVKAQVDYIKERVPDAEVFVHPHTGEAGAIGAAMEALRVVKRKGSTSFIGLDTALNIEYVTTNDQSTVCHFCENHCSRTFIDTTTLDGNTTRYISGFSCEKGTVEDKEAVIALTKQRNDLKVKYPNLVEYEAKRMFERFFEPEPMPSEEMFIDDVKLEERIIPFLEPKRTDYKRRFQRSPQSAAETRSNIKIGIPRVLGIWTTAPFWKTYFEVIGLDLKNVIFSDYTSEGLWMKGGKYGSVDPCYPSKVVQAHVHNLLTKHHEKHKLNYIFFPCITHLPTFLDNVMDTSSCPIVSGSPNVIKAAFTKETNFFKVKNVIYLDPAVTFVEKNFMKKQLFEAFCELLMITEDENSFAVDQGLKAMEAFDKKMEAKGKAILEDVEKNGRLALVMIGRPYHSDPGLNHRVLDEYQVKGYPILSMRSIPKDHEWVAKYFQSDLQTNRISSPFDINDVWPENFSANSAQKVWVTKFAARHPNLALLDLSSFKCGHDAPTYGIIDSITGTANVPYSALHDIDANRPSGSIKIRVKTYHHSLKLREELLEDKLNRKQQREEIIGDLHVEETS